MSQVKGKNTKPELIIRSLLHKAGYRFRIHVATLPGKPDIVLSKYKTAIFVHGCFWHRHPQCKYATVPNSRKDFWRKKFKRNIERHKEVEKQLKQLGWNIIVIWECNINSHHVIDKLIQRLKQ